MKRLTSLYFALIAILFLLTMVRPSLAQHPKTVPLYRFYSQKTGIHFFTSDINRKLEAVGAGWSDEGIAAYVVDQQAPDTVPLFVFVIPLRYGANDNQSIGHVFAYTTSENEKTQILQSAVSHADCGPSHWGFDHSGIAAYIASKQLPGTVPLYRLSHPGNFSNYYSNGGRGCLASSFDSLLTASEEEKATALTKHGYRFVGIEGYVWQKPTTLGPKIFTTNTGSANPDTALLNRGCTRSGGGAYNCSSVAGYELCEVYRQQGKVKACSTTANLKVQGAMEKLLISVGCTRLLGRADEFLCKTPKSFDTCEAYRKNGTAKKCLMAKQ